MEARWSPIDTPAAEYRPWRLPSSTRVVTRPEVKSRIGKRPGHARAHLRRRAPPPTSPHGDDKRGRDRVRGAWCESVAEAAGLPEPSPPLSHAAGNHTKAQVM